LSQFAKSARNSRSSYRLRRRLQAIQESYDFIDVGYSWKRLTFLGIIDIYIKWILKLSGNPPNFRGPLFETQLETPSIKGLSTPE